VAHADRASSGARRASGVDAGELHVGTLFSISVGVLPKALRGDHPRHPRHPAAPAQGPGRLAPARKPRALLRSFG
jgi:hypothetical protein